MARKLTDQMTASCGFCMTGEQVEAGLMRSTTWPEADDWYRNCAGDPCASRRRREDLPPLRYGDYLFYKENRRLPTDDEFTAMVNATKSKKKSKSGDAGAEEEADDIDLAGFTLEDAFEATVDDDSEAEWREDDHEDRRNEWLLRTPDPDKPQTVAQLPDDHWLVQARYEVEEVPVDPTTTAAADDDFTLDDDEGTVAVKTRTRRTRKTKSGKATTRVSLDDVDMGDFEL